jgi:AcrR family transcriptional regulator
VSEREPIDDRREQMLRAAIEVIGERGFPDTRIADVGKRVGASSALVIYYFGTKDSLLTEALRFSEDLFYAEVAGRLAGIADARGKLEDLVRYSCTIGERGMPGSWVLWVDLWAQAVRHPDVARHREELDQRWRRQIEDIVREGQATGEFTPLDPERFTVMFSSLLDGLIVQLVLGDSHVTQELAIDLCMSLAAGQLGFDWTAEPQSRGRARRVAAT